MSKGVILAVDDSAESLNLLTQILAKEGYDVTAASSGEQALAIVEAGQPDLIILDIQMPDMSGFDVFRRLNVRKETRNVPVVFITGTSDIAERVEGLRLGAVDCVQKPFRPEELIARVSTHLELGRLRARLEKALVEQTIELQLATESLELPLENAVRSGDWALVLRLFEPTAMVSIMRHDHTREWVLRLPKAACDAEPGLAFWLAFVHLCLGRAKVAETIAEPADLRAADPARRGLLRTLRAKAAELRGESEAAVRLAVEAIALFGPEGSLESPLEQIWLGTAYCTAGQPRKGEEALRAAITLAEKATGSRRWLIPVCYTWYGRSLYLQGRLNDALTVCRQAFSLEREYGGPTITISYAFESQILVCRNLLDAAQQSLEKALDLDGSLEQWFALPVSWCTAAAFYYARGNTSAGDRVVDGLLEWGRRNDAATLTTKAESFRVNNWLKEVRVERAWLWAAEKKINENAALDYAAEPALLSLARVYLHRAATTGDTALIERALGLLRRLQQSSEADGRMGDYLVALVAESLAHHALGRDEEALTVFERCLVRAVPECVIRVFLDEGSPMLGLCELAVARGVLPETSACLVAMLRGDVAGPSCDPNGPSAKSPSMPPSKPAGGPEKDNSSAMPLTDREFELLSLIASGLTNSQLASTLFISSNTVKTHIRHLFEKLNASSRTELVARARQLGLLN